MEPLTATTTRAGDEREAFEAWFQSQQGIAYAGMWEFARAAWQARAALATAPEQAGEPVAEVVKWRTFTGHTAWDFKVFDKTLEHGTKLYTAPPPASTNRLTDMLAFKEALHEHFNAFPIPTQIGVTAIMKHIEKVYTAIIAATEGK